MVNISRLTRAEKAPTTKKFFRATARHSRVGFQLGSGRVLDCAERRARLLRSASGTRALAAFIGRLLDHCANVSFSEKLACAKRPAITTRAALSRTRAVRTVRLCANSVRRPANN